MITWNDVFGGRKCGIQVWTRRNTHRYLYKIFENRKTNSIGLNKLLNVFYEELFGDCVQLLSLCNCYLRSQLSNSTALIKKATSSTQPLPQQSSQLSQNAFQAIIKIIESTFDKASPHALLNLLLSASPSYL